MGSGGGGLRLQASRLSTGRDLLWRALHLRPDDGAGTAVPDGGPTRRAAASSDADHLRSGDCVVSAGMKCGPSWCHEVKMFTDDSIREGEPPMAPPSSI